MCGYWGDIFILLVLAVIEPKIFILFNFSRSDFFKLYHKWVTHL